MASNSLLEERYCYCYRILYSPKVGRNLINTSLLEFIDYDMLFGKGRVEILLNGNISALWNLSQWSIFVLDNPLEVGGKIIYLVKMTPLGGTIL